MGGVCGGVLRSRLSLQAAGSAVPHVAEGPISSRGLVSARSPPENFSRSPASLSKEPRYRRNEPPGMIWRSDGPSAGVMSVGLGDEAFVSNARS